MDELVDGVVAEDAAVEEVESELSPAKRSV